MIQTQVKEKPILFSTPMVRAILDGRKSMTRRVLNPQPVCHGDNWWSHQSRGITTSFKTGEQTPELLALSPYPVGTRLWVRETHYRYGHWRLTGKLTETGKPEWEFIADIDSIRYYNNPPDKFRVRPSVESGWYKRPSIFMPKWASRINLEVTEVRVQRVREISEDDAEAEGCQPGYILATPTIFHKGIDGYTETAKDYREGFHRLWDSLNAKRGYSWEVNPFVWAYTFKKLEVKN